MPRKEILDRIQKYIRPFRIWKGKGFQLKKIDPSDTYSGNSHRQSPQRQLLRAGRQN